MSVAASFPGSPTLPDYSLRFAIANLAYYWGGGMANDRTKVLERTYHRQTPTLKGKVKHGRPKPSPNASGG